MYSLNICHRLAIELRRSVNGGPTPFISLQTSKYASVPNVGPAVFQIAMQANPYLFFFAQHIKVEQQHQQGYNSSLTSQAALYCPSATSSHGIFGQIPLSLDYCCSFTQRCAHTYTTARTCICTTSPVLSMPSETTL